MMKLKTGHIALTLILFVLMIVGCNSLFPQSTPTTFVLPFPSPIVTLTQAPVTPTATLPVSSGLPTLPPTQSLPIGRWQITRYGFASISAMDKAQADTWLNKIADISVTNIAFDGKTCQVTSTGRSTSTTSDYFLVGFKTNPANIGVTQDKLDVIKTNCTGTPFEQFGQLDSATIVIAWNGVFFFMTPAGQTVATVPPTQAQPATTVKRISFAPGATSATVQGNVAANSVDQYVLRVSGGQTIAVAVNSQTAMWLSVNGADGNVLKSMGAGTANWSGIAPTTQDYFLTLSTQNQTAAGYTLQVTVPPLAPVVEATPVPKRISFAPGAISASVSGALPKNGMDRWVIRVQAGQTMTAKAIPQNGNVMLIVFGVDGDVYQTDHVGSPDFSQQMRTTQDYYIDVRAWGDTAPSYTLQVTVPPIGQPVPTSTPRRISFAPGAISASVQGSTATPGQDRFVIRAQAGQTMIVNAASAQNNVILIIYGADGNVLISDHAGATSWTGVLPTTQDYIIDTRSFQSTVVPFTLQVTIPPK